ncbi:MAG: hypothetical protein JST73_01275 [Actinobacteria bacterium]|nr:hypothetical protein [Actinomycetota bacterium]
MSEHHRSPDGSILVPDTDAPAGEILQFALSYNGYARHGGLSGIGERMNRLASEFERTGHLSDDLDELRTALFFEQRRAHHFEPSGPSWPTPYVAALLEKIRFESGGTVPGPGDPWP